LLILASATPAKYGEADWAPGFFEENQFDEDNQFDDDGLSEEWSVVQKAVLFGVVLTAVGIWVRVSKRREPTHDIGHEKSMA